MTTGKDKDQSELEHYLTDTDFKRIRTMIYDLTRIKFDDGKKSLVQARLNKRLRALGLANYKQYLRLVEADQSGAELSNLVDSLTTNLTYFFREPDHFEYLGGDFLASHTEKRLRIWSAGCASGEEAYTIAMVLRESMEDLDGRDVLILATDVSARVLQTAKNGIYSVDRFKDTPAELREKYFERVSNPKIETYSAREELRKLIRFRRLNLMGTWPMKNPFDLIFCRNVMIYFDRPTQGELINRYHDALRPGGVLIVGHSESMTGIRHSFKKIQKTIYQREE